MRLINTATGQFEEFVEEEIPLYAILSHTWDKKEQTYQEVVKIQERYRDQPDDPGSVQNTPSTSEVPICPQSHARPAPSMSSENPHDSKLEAGVSLEIQSTPRSIWDLNSGLSEKVRRACEIARHDGYRYIWIDSCCIDKKSSSELSEAINSMFNWYRASQVCYAFLVDVPSDDKLRRKGSAFRESKWFTRGWTLQELVAPRRLVFLSKDWKGLGTKQGLAEVIQEITSIDVEILTHKKTLSKESVANRMGWASRRQTTRVEDRAYSLLGIFGITMPTLYGEGQYAFRRLQEEILRRIPDQSIFAWGSADIQTFPMTHHRLACFQIRGTETLLASSPSDFVMKNNQIIPATEGSVASVPLPIEEYTHTPYGIRTQLCLLPLRQLNPDFNITILFDDPTVSWYLAILCAQKAAANPQGLLGQLCHLRQSDKANIELLYREHFLGADLDPPSSLYELSPDVIARVDKLETYWKTVYLPHPKPSELVSVQQPQDVHSRDRRLSLSIPMWVHDALQVDSFTLSNIQGPTEHDPNSFSFTLLHAAFNIHILYQHATDPPWLYNDTSVVIKACSWILPPGNEPLSTNVIQLSPPSDSATWVQVASKRILPSQLLVLHTTSGGDNLVTVLLSLGLDLTAPYLYNIHFDAAPQISEVGASTCTHSQNIQPDSGLELELPYKTLDFILPGSVRRSLETRGYSVRLSLEPSLGDTHSHSLTLSTDSDGKKFSIVVKYLQVHMLDGTVLARRDLNLDLRSDSESESDSKERRRNENIYIVARITVEPSDGDFETVHDDPHVVAWSDRYPWKGSLGRKDVILTTPTGDPLTLRLGFVLAWLYQYYLHVDITPSPPDLSSTPTRITSYDDEPKYLPGWAHRCISLTLPTHVNRALQAQGFQVRFKRLEGGGASGDPIHHLLTLSHTRAGFDIVIKYLHDLPTDYPDPHSHPNDPEVKRRYRLLQANPQLASDSSLPAPTAKASVKRCLQGLTFKASIQTSTSHSAQIGDTPSQLAVLDDITTVEVDWWDGLAWKRHLERKDITLTLPTGRQLVLRLGFDLVWYSEYCPTVEINSRISLYQWERPRPDYELGDDGMEYFRQASSQSAEPGVGESAEAPNEDLEPLMTDLTTLEESPVGSRGPEDAGNSDAKEQPREGADLAEVGQERMLLKRSATESHVDDETSDSVPAAKRRR